MPKPTEQFISEPIVPVPGSLLAAPAARGEPGLPERFTWRGDEYRVTEVRSVWKTTGPCTSGSAEQYVRRHWYQAATEPPAVMTLYFDRQPRDSRHPKARWWLYTVSEDT